MEYGPVSSSQVIESLHSEDEQRRGARDPEAMPREDSLLPQEEGNGVFRPTISSLEEVAEPSWPSVPASEVDFHAEDQRRSTDDNLASKTNQKSQKTATCRRRHGQEGARDPEARTKTPQATIHKLTKAEPSWPSLPAPEVDIHAEDQRRSTDDNLASKTNQKSQKTATCRRRGQEGATGIPDLCKAQPASVNDNSHPQAAGITKSDSVLEAGSYPQDQSATGGVIETGCPVESEDDTGSYGFVPSLQRENELLRCKLECAEQEIHKLRCNEQFLVESLRHKSQECAQVCVEKCHLEQQLEASRAASVIDRQQINELTDENVSILDELDESNEMLLKVFILVCILVLWNVRTVGH